MGSKRLTLIIGAIFSIGAILLLFSQVDFNEFTDHLRRADERYIAGMVIILFISLWIRTIRWQTLLQEPMPFDRSFYIINVSYLLNVTFPFRLGEVARVLLMSREPRQSAGSGFSALAMERLFDLSIALICVGLGLVFLPDDASLPPEVASSVGFFIVLTITGIAIVLFSPPLHPFFLRIAHIITGFLPAAIGARLMKFIEDTLNGLRDISQPRRLIQGFFWSVLTWISYIIYYQLGLYAFMQDTPSLAIGMLVLGFVAVGAAAPSLPGAVGVFQAAAVLALSMGGYDTGIATSYAWGVWVPQNLFSIIIGMISLWLMGLSFTGLTREVQAEMEHSV